MPDTRDSGSAKPPATPAVVASRSSSSDRAGGFVVQAKRWIVERTLAWISRNRRLARDFENLAATAKALIYLAMIKLMLRRLARA